MKVLEAGAYALLLAGLMAVLFWAAIATAPEPRVYPAALDLVNQTPDAMVLAPPASKVTSQFVEEVLRLHHEVGGEMQD